MLVYNHVVLTSQLNDKIDFSFDLRFEYCLFAAYYFAENQSITSKTKNLNFKAITSIFKLLHCECATKSQLRTLSELVHK